MMAAAIGMIIVALALLIFCVAVMWKVFCKAGEPGWASLIPFYNLYVMTRITWGRGWLFIFGFLPLGNLIFAIFTMIKLAKVFGKKGGFACAVDADQAHLFPFIDGKGRVVKQQPFCV